MSAWRLERQRMIGGVWTGMLSGPDGEDPPELAVTWLGNEIALPDIAPEGPGRWAVTLSLPPKVMADGTQTILIGPRGQPALCSETFVFGDPLEGDVRSEVSLLRAELDLLKRAFRRHCAEDD